MIARSLMRFHEGGKRADCKIVFKWLQKHQTIIIFTVKILFKGQTQCKSELFTQEWPVLICTSLHYPCMIPPLNAFSDFPSVQEMPHQQPVDQ